MRIISNRNKLLKKDQKTKITFELPSREKRAFSNLKRTIKSELDINISTTAFLRHCMKQARNIEFLYEIGFISKLDYMGLILMKEKKNIKYKRAKNVRFNK